LGQFKVGQIAAEKKPILTNSVIGDPRIPDQEWAKREELIAFAGYPLVRDQDVAGVMGLFSKHPLTDFTLNSLGMVADRITTAIEYQLATEANQELARLNERILTSAGEGIFGIDHEGSTTFINPAAANMLGYDLEALVGAPMHATIHHTKSDGSPCLKEECPMLAAFNGGAVKHEGEEVLWRKNGSAFSVEYTATPIWVTGQVAGAVVTFKDISERKFAEEAHHRVCQQLELTLAALPGSIMVVNRDQEIVYANARANENFEQETSSLLGSLIHEVLPFTATQWNGLAEEFVFRNKDGMEELDLEFEDKDRTFGYHLFPISLEGREVSQTGIVIWDITERKKLQSQLIQSEKLSSLGTLVSGMVHEVRSPMQSIVGFTELILEEDNPLAIREFAGDLKRVSQHITTVLTDFMIYARPSSDERAIAIDLNERLLEALKMVQRGPTFGNVGVEQQFTVLPPVSIRQAEIDQVFINLIANAVQAMEGNGRLRLATFHKDHVVTVQISDTGGGIPKELLSKIFDPFFSTKEKGKGTGLGLSIVHQIVKDYGGQVTIESQVGEGTTFVLQFPEYLNP
jgi:PAS domain S-box-containing protein